MGSLVAVLWLAGPFLVAAISFVVRHWQVLQLLGSLPYAVCLTYWWCVIHCLPHLLVVCDSLSVSPTGGV